jgi:hypothetical protein
MKTIKYLHNSKTNEIAPVTMTGINGNIYLQRPLKDGNDVIAYTESIDWHQIRRTDNLVQEYRKVYAKRNGMTPWRDH